MKYVGVTGDMLPLVSIDEAFVLEGLQRYKCETAPPRVPQNARLLVRGWAAFVDGRAPGVVRDFSIDGTPLDARIRHEPRHDVAAHYGIPALLGAGFVASIDVRELPLGAHRLQTHVDGVAAPDAFAFIVEEPRAPAKAIVRDDSDRFAIAQFYGRLDAPARTFRLERGLCGIVRGSISGVHVREIHVIIDGRDAFPGLLYDSVMREAPAEPANRTFLTCFRTADLQIGTHVVELVATLPGGEQVFSRPWTFDMVDLEYSPPRNDEPRLSVSLQWPDEPLSAEPGSASSRVLRPDEIAVFRGWALDERHARLAYAAYLVFDCGVQIRLELGASRPDVSLHHGLPQTEFCGFTGSVATAALAPGINTGRCYVFISDRHAVLRSEATITIDVRP